MFACLSLIPGGVVTRYAGKVSVNEPLDAQYCVKIAITNSGKMYIDDIRVPQLKLRD